MTQFNLLPDVKIEYIKTRNRKRLIVLIAAIASGITLLIFILLFLYVRVNQTKHIGDLDKDIKANVSKIQQTQDLDKILTIQNQLDSLPELHDKKMVSSRVVDYMNKVTPNEATLSNVTLDFDASTLALKGNANNLATVNKFVDALKFTDYKVNNEGAASGKAFKGVVLQSFSVGADGTAKAVSFEIGLNFEPVIFQQVKDVKQDATEPVTLTVPSIVSTRSETEKPNLFAPQPKPATEGGN